jgi:hypothetical protein
LDQTLTGGITGNAGTATKWANKVVVNGTDLDGATTPVTIGVNTTAITTSGTYYPTFVPTNVAGNQQASTHASLSYNPSNGYLSATRFVGSGAGLTNVVTSISFNGATAVSGALSITQNAYGLSAIGTDNNSTAVRLYSSSSVGATYAFNQNTSSSILRTYVTGLPAVDPGEVALRAVFNATNPATTQIYADLTGDGVANLTDAIQILQIVSGTGSATARSNQLLAAIAASADVGLIVAYGWISSSLAGDVLLKGSGGITASRSGNTITFDADSVDLTGYATETFVTTAISNNGGGGGNLQSNLILNGKSIQGTGTIGITGSITATAFFYASDHRLKTDIQNISNSDNVITSLRPVSFTWIENGHKDLGFIAQEVKTIIPTAVTADTDGILSVNYSNIVAHLTAKVQSQDLIIKDLQSKVELLMKKL